MMDYPIAGTAKTKVRFNTNARNLANNRAVISIDVPLALDMRLAAGIEGLDGKQVLITVQDMGYPDVESDLGSTPLAFDVDDGVDEQGNP